MAKVRKRTWTSGGEVKTAWVADYFDQDRKRHIKTFDKRKDAEGWLHDTVGEVKRGTHTAERASITVAQACDIWLERGRRESLERGTMQNYRHHTRRIKKSIGAVKLAQLTSPKVAAFRDQLLDQGCSRKTARTVLGCLKGVLREAQNRGYVAQNVALSVSVSLKARDQRKLAVGRDIPSKAEINTILSTAEGRWRPLFVTAVFTGMRASELRGLQWSDIDFDAKVINVHRRANRWGDMGQPKSKAGQRSIPMSPSVVNVLREWKLACPKGVAGLAFPNGIGKVETHANIVNRGWFPTQERASIVDDKNDAKYPFHSLRHFAASWLIEQGFSAKRLQSLLGHASIQMTFDRYGHLFPSLEDDHAKFAAGELSIVGG